MESMSLDSTCMSWIASPFDSLMRATFSDRFCLAFARLNIDFVTSLISALRCSRLSSEASFALIFLFLKGYLQQPTLGIFQNFGNKSALNRKVSKHARGHSFYHGHRSWNNCRIMSARHNKSVFLTRREVERVLRLCYRRGWLECRPKD